MHQSAVETLSEKRPFHGEKALRPEPPFTGVSGRSGPEIAKTSQRGSLGCPQESPRKFPKKSKNTRRSPTMCIFRLFRVFSGTFPRTPKKTLFETSVAISGPERPETLVNGGSGRKESLQTLFLISAGFNSPFWVFCRFLISRILQLMQCSKELCEKCNVASHCAKSAKIKDDIVKTPIVPMLETRAQITSRAILNCE